VQQQCGGGAGARGGREGIVIVLEGAGERGARAGPQDGLSTRQLTGWGGGAGNIVVVCIWGGGVKPRRVWEKQGQEQVLKMCSALDSSPGQFKVGVGVCWWGSGGGGGS
jgi:hypothetical protein